MLFNAISRLASRALQWSAIAFYTSHPCFCDDSGTAGAKPNIVMILADDLGYGDLACYGHPDIKTPSLDRLAAEGVRFTNHYANGPECSPTRTAFLTGRYQQWVGGLECAIGTGNVGRYDDAIRLAHANELGLPVEEQTIVRLLQDAGYATALCGKWHLGYEPKFAPHLHGFDRTFYCIGGGMDYFHYLDTVAGYNLFSEGRPIRREGYFTDLMTDEAVDFLKHNHTNPFFLYVAYTAPHSPFQGPGDYRPDPLPLDSPLWNQGNAPADVYIKMIEHMDTCIGQLLNTLADLDVAKDTIVIFASDNGGTASARNAPFSHIKGSTYEGGIRVPGMVRWPGVIAENIVSEQPCITFDFTASIARAAGVTPSTDKPFEGMDIIEHAAKQEPVLDRTLFWRKPRGETVWEGLRQGNLKYVGRWTDDEHEDYLFDVAADPAEKHDLAAERPAELIRLRAVYEEWEERVRRHRRGQAE